MISFLLHKISHEFLRPFQQLNRKLIAWKERLQQIDTDNTIAVDAHVYRGWSGRIIPQNWGDDLNAHFLEPLFGKKMRFENGEKRTGIRHYQFIGSIINPYLGKTERIVWGSGLLHRLSGTEKLGNQKILAVRGPLTRASLLSCGTECPEVYGDPALLLPQFIDYTPPPYPERTGIGIISAWWEHKNPMFFKFMKNVGADARRIKTRGYKDWKDFIREICSCKFVISSSLHGIIVAEAYNIPCLWVIFSTKKQNDDHYFKYWDFYQSIGKNVPAPLLITETTSAKELCERIKTWSPGKIETSALLAACPFPIHAKKI